MHPLPQRIRDGIDKCGRYCNSNYMREVVHELRVARAEATYNVTKLSSEVLLEAIERSLRDPNGPYKPGADYSNSEPASPEVAYVMKKYQAHWKTEAQIENKKHGIAERFVLGQRVTADDMARRMANELYTKAGGTEKRPPKKEALLAVVGVFRPKEAKVIKAEDSLPKTEKRIIDEIVKFNDWYDVPRYVRNAKEKYVVIPEKLDESLGRIQRVIQKRLDDRVKKKNGEGVLRIVRDFDGILEGTHQLKINNAPAFASKNVMRNSFWAPIVADLRNEIVGERIDEYVRKRNTLTRAGLDMAPIKQSKEMNDALDARLNSRLDTALGNLKTSFPDDFAGLVKRFEDAGFDVAGYFERYGRKKMADKLLAIIDTEGAETYKTHTPTFERMGFDMKGFSGTEEAKQGITAQLSLGLTSALNNLSSDPGRFPTLKRKYSSVGFDKIVDDFVASAEQKTKVNDKMLDVFESEGTDKMFKHLLTVGAMGFDMSSFGAQKRAVDILNDRLLGKLKDAFGQISGINTENFKKLIKKFKDSTYNFPVDMFFQLQQVMTLVDGKRRDELHTFGLAHLLAMDTALESIGIGQGDFRTSKSATEEMSLVLHGRLDTALNNLQSSSPGDFQKLVVEYKDAGFNTSAFMTSPETLKTIKDKLLSILQDEDISMFKKHVPTFKKMGFNTDAFNASDEAIRAAQEKLNNTTYQRNEMKSDLIALGFPDSLT